MPDLTIMPYRQLSSLVKDDTEHRKAAASEIRARRKAKNLPEIRAFKEYSLSDNQRWIFDTLIRALTGSPEVREIDKIKIMSVSYKVKGGWVVYVTGEDQERVAHKISLIKKMVLDDAAEFGLCRVCLSAVRKKEWDGILVRFDRGLRLVYE